MSNVLDKERKTLNDLLKDLAYIQDESGLTQWEQDFVRDMNAKSLFYNFSAKQKETIVKLAEKYDV